MIAQIKQVTVSLPEQVLDNEQICAEMGGWTPEKISKKLGIEARHVLAEDETPADLAVEAARSLLDREPGLASKIDFLIFCTQSPDYVLPTSACIIQDRLGLSKDIGAIDVNQGCSGYVYGLSLAKGLVDSKLARNVLLLTADGYSKLVGRTDASTRTIFGDAGTATLIAPADDETDEAIGSFVFGTDGAGADKLIVEGSGMRAKRGAPRSDLFMDGPAVLTFTLREVPPMFEKVLERAGLTRDDLDFVILHQANKFLLSQLQRKLGIDDEKMMVDFADVGNTVSSTIPLVLSRALERGQIRKGQTGALLGFGVGLSWAGCIVRL